MQNKIQQNSDKVIRELSKLLFDYYYSLSTEAACKGDYSLANNYISDLIETNGEVNILLDLQAKINAQQGKLREAEFLWKKCVKADPDNVKYVEALNRIYKLQKTKVTWRINLAKLIGIIVTLLILSFIFVVVLYGTGDKTSKLEILQKQQSEILERIDSSFNTKESVPIDILISEIANKVEKVNGISFKKNDMELLIKFNEGLFSNGIKIKLSEEPSIKQLAKILEIYSGNILITILGCSDNTPITDSAQFQSNHALSLARANFIYNIFYKNSRILTESLIFGSAGNNNTPFSNDNRENRMKNRTVVIKIIQKKY